MKLKYIKKIFPTKIENIVLWLFGAGIEFLGFYLLFSQGKTLLGLIIIVIGLIVALNSRGMGK